MTQRFKAGVQYGDWEGTAAADDADQIAIRQFLTQRGLLHDEQFVIGIEVLIGENHAGRVKPPYINVLVVDKPAYENVQELLTKPGPVEVKVITLEEDLSLEQFIGLFKRFSIAISRRGLNFTNREYDAVQVSE
jgi:hypothetical protein